jgi:hypothetical protein
MYIAPSAVKPRSSMSAGKIQLIELYWYVEFVCAPSFGWNGSAEIRSSKGKTNTTPKTDSLFPTRFISLRTRLGRKNQHAIPRPQASGSMQYRLPTRRISVTADQHNEHQYPISSLTRCSTKKKGEPPNPQTRTTEARKRGVGQRGDSLPSHRRRLVGKARRSGDVVGTVGGDASFPGRVEGGRGGDSIPAERTPRGKGFVLLAGKVGAQAGQRQADGGIDRFVVLRDGRDGSALFAYGSVALVRSPSVCFTSRV